MVASTKFFKKWAMFEGDKVVWMILFFLVMISIIEVYSASSNMSYGTGYYWKPILQHVSYFLIGGVAAILIHKIHCRYFKLIPLAGIPLSVFMLVIALFTSKVNNASRWLEVGGIGFQPSEIAKGVLITKAGSVKAPTSLNSNSLQSQIDSIDKQIDRWQDKMSSQIDRYTTQFSRLEQLIAQMNSQASAMSGLMGGSTGY